MSPIYKMFNGKHIDLSKIVCISEPRFSSGPWIHVRFSIHFQLMDSPIEFHLSVSRRPCRDDYDIIVPTLKDLGLEEEGSGHEFYYNQQQKWLDLVGPIAEAAAQAKIEEIIAAWKAFNARA